MPSERKCGDCGAKPGGLHQLGCDVERCPLCGYQMIACSCVYELNGLNRSDLEIEHPDIYVSGPTSEMYVKYDAEIEKCGGRLPWTGYWPGEVECREWGWFCKWDGKWVACESTDPDAQPHTSRLYREALWDRTQRRFVLRNVKQSG